jgi:hypothetical protein
VKLRRIISLTMFVSFIFLSFTGIMLFFSPQGRVAYWSGWKMFGLSKEEYSAVHTTFMVLFLAAGIWHIVLNWKPIVAYLRDRRKKVKVFTPEFSFAFVVCLLFFIGTLAGLFPYQQFLHMGEDIKDYWEHVKGSPPWGHAEISPLDRFCRGMEDFERLENQRLVTIEPDDAVIALRNAGIDVMTVSERLIDIAERNSTTPKALTEIILTAAKPISQKSGEDPPSAQSGPFVLPYSGLGRMTLRQYAEKYEADLERMLSILRKNGMDIDPDKKLREESGRFGTDPEGIIIIINKSASGIAENQE